MGASDDGAHSQNEKLDLRNYIEGVILNFFDSNSSIVIWSFICNRIFFILQTKVMASYLFELGKIKGSVWKFIHYTTESNIGT